MRSPGAVEALAAAPALLPAGDFAWGELIEVVLQVEIVISEIYLRCFSLNYFIQDKKEKISSKGTDIEIKEGIVP